MIKECKFSDFSLFLYINTSEIKCYKFRSECCIYIFDTTSYEFQAKVFVLVEIYSLDLTCILK